jgi:hypothetical protein
MRRTDTRTRQRRSHDREGTEEERTTGSTTRSESRGGSRSADRSDSGTRSDPVGALHATVGNQAVSNQAVEELHERGQLQAKLAVSQPGDAAEREAERVADEVLAPRATESENGEDSDTETPELRRSAGSSAGSGSVSSGREGQIRSALTGGQSLPASTQSFFEERFGQDFSDVRVHTGPRADEAAQSIDAEAFTLGSDVAFARGAYRPQTSEGKRLLAHELTHVVQQGGSGGTATRRTVQRQSALPHAEAIESRLSYSTFDWAVTDSDARDVLDKLDELPEEMLEQMVHQLERQGLLDRLLNNIPEATAQNRYPLINKVKYLASKPYQTLSKASMDMLREIDNFLSGQAQVFVQLVGTSPWVNLALSNPLETLAGMVGAGSLSPLPGKYAQAVRASKQIVGGAVRKKISLFYLRNEGTLSPKEREFWKGMMEIWAP